MTDVKLLRDCFYSLFPRMNAIKMNAIKKVSPMMKINSTTDDGFLFSPL